MKSIFLTIIVVCWISFLSIGQEGKQRPTVPLDSTLYQGKQDYLSHSLPPKTFGMNVIFIVADDLGKFDLSIFGNPYIQTPNIDQLAKDGLLFNTNYATAAVCSPSRAGFITGRYQQRFGFHIQPHQRYPKNRFELWFFQKFINTNDLKPENYQKTPSKKERKKMGLPPSEITIADMLKHNGYRTGWVGKWHLGYHNPILPQHFGFDYTYGFLEAYSLFAYPNDKSIVNARIDEFTDKVIWRGKRKKACAIYENGKKIKVKEYITYEFFKKAKEFIGENDQQPFFLYLPVNAPHTPYQAPKDIYDSLSHIKNHNQRVYYSMIVALDNCIGDLVDFLKKTNQYENTLIIFTSDNGAALYTQTVTNEPLNAGKFTLFEGGTNIPLIIHNPKLIQTPHEVNQMTSLLDIFPTIAEVTGSPLPSDRDYDGISLVPYFEQHEIESQRKALYWYSDYNSAIRIGDYKLILNDYDHTVDLYNLKDDPYEKHNLSNEKEQIEYLKNQLEIWKTLMPEMYWPRIMNYEIEINGKIYHWSV